MEKIKIYIQGLLMAFADSVPGVSGGTVAFLLNFYDRFIKSLDTILTGNMTEKKKALPFLTKLAIGWAVGFVVAMLILGKVFESHIYVLSSLFLGFIIFAIPIVIKEEMSVLKSDKKGIIFGIIGVVVVLLIGKISGTSIMGNVSLKFSDMSIGIWAYLFIGGAVAISAMVLPGISGSTLLLIMGLYVPIISAIKDTLHFNFEYVLSLAIFGFGVIFGLLFSVKIIKKSLIKHRAKVIYLIIGLMCGSIYPIITGPTTLNVPMPAMSLMTFSPCAFVIGGAIIFGMQYAKNKKTVAV